MGTNQKKVVAIFRLLIPFVICISVIGYFARPIVTKKLVIGPFDFLVNYYHPYKDLPWEKTPDLYAQYTKPKNILMSDVVSVVFPMKYYTIESLKKGIIPLWDPHILSGAPHLANTQSSVFNPFNIFFFIAGYASAYNLFIITQLIIACIGMYLFLRKVSCTKTVAVMGGLSFAFSGYMTVWLPWGTIGYAYAMLPWALLLVEKYFFLSLLPLSVSIFSGHIQTACIVIMLFYAYAVFKKISIKMLLLHGMLLFCLGAPQLLPTLQLNGLSARNMVSGESFYRDQSIQVPHLVSMFAPDFFGNLVTRNWWGKNNYAETVSFVGTLFFVLFITELVFTIIKLYKKERLDKNLLFFVCLSLIGIILSVENPLLFILWKLNIPIFSTSTFSRNLSITMFSSIVAGCLFLQHLPVQKLRVQRMIIACGVLFGITVFIWTTTLVVMRFPDLQQWFPVAIRNLILPTLFIAIDITLLVLLAKNTNRTAVLIITVLLFSVQIVDIVRFSQKYTPFSPREFFYPPTPIAQYMHSNLFGQKYYNYVDGNFAMMLGGTAVNGSDPLYIREYGELLYSARTGKPDVQDRAAVNLNEGLFSDRIMNILSVKYVVDKNRTFQSPWENRNPNRKFDTVFPPIWSDGIYSIRHNTDANSQFYFVPSNNVRLARDNSKALAVLLSDTFDPKNEITITTDKIQKHTTERTRTTKKANVQVIELTSQTKKFRITTYNDGVFFVNSTYYPTWRATVDGRTSQILKADYAFQGIQLSPGTHSVIMSYDDKVFKIGILLFMCSLLISARVIYRELRPLK
ncbi:MAG: YfhO family protein [Patescibacteria group bacterium]|jgi:hypothetical protein